MWRSSTKWVLMYAHSIFRFPVILNVLFTLISTLKTIFIYLENWKKYHQFSGIILYLNSIKSEFSSSIYSKLSDVHYDSFCAGASHFTLDQGIGHQQTPSIPSYLGQSSWFPSSSFHSFPHLPPESVSKEVMASLLFFFLAGSSQGPSSGCCCFPSLVSLLNN